MIYKAYELLPHLEYLILTAGDNGEIEWVGKAEDFKKVEKEIDYYENNL